MINFCGFRPKGSSEKALENEKNGVVVVKPRMKVKKSPEKKQLCIDKCKITTLEDLIVSSPAAFDSTHHDCMNIPCTHKQYSSSSRKIHPSFDGDLKQPFLTTNQPLNGEADAAFGRTKSAKPKKKVSFRSPEVADVFLLPNINTS